MTADSPWYAGPCIKRHDLVSVQAQALLTQSSLAMLENRQKLFGKSDEVALKAAAGGGLKGGEWVLFQVSKRDKRGWIAGAHTLLKKYVDLSAAGTIDAVRRLLTVEGVASLPSGMWLVRVSGDEVIEVELRLANGVAKLASECVDVPAYKFCAEAVISSSIANTVAFFYDHSKLGVPLTIHEWSGDELFAIRALRAIMDITDPRVAELIGWLEEYSRMKKSLVLPNHESLAELNVALRSGELARRLSNDRKMSVDFVDALFADPRVSEIINARAQSIADEERKTLRAKAESENDQWAKQDRRERRAALDAELRAAESNARRLMDENLAMREKEALEAILSLARKTQASVEHELAGKRGEVAKFMAQSQAELASVQHDKTTALNAVQATEARLSALKLEEDRAAQNLDRLLALLQAFRPGEGRDTNQVVVPLQASDAAESLALEKVYGVIKSCPLLSGQGKKLMLQFIALLLAGEVPILFGRDVDDFLLIASTIISAGRSARLEADPTIIAFEDIWVRAGTGSPTTLAQAIKATQGGSGTILAVIQGAERSGARFWFPALAERSRSGDLPRRFLVCATVSDEDSEESQMLFTSAVRLHIHSALDPNAAMIAIAVLIHGTRYDLVPGARPISLLDGIEAVTPYSQRLTLMATLRAARAIVESKRLGSVPPEFLSSIVQLFASPTANLSAAA